MGKTGFISTPALACEKTDLNIAASKFSFNLSLSVVAALEICCLTYVTERCLNEQEKLKIKNYQLEDEQKPPANRLQGHARPHPRAATPLGPD